MRQCALCDLSASRRRSAAFGTPRKNFKNLKNLKNLSLLWEGVSREVLASR
jgi:hypothetical protein